MKPPLSEPDRVPLDGPLDGPTDIGRENPRAASMKFLYPSGASPLEGYTIKRGVGRGGFGEVYFATSDAGKEVALKLIRRNLDVELRGVRHCLNLKHHNLIALYDIRSDDLEDQWVVMEYVSGQSLEDVIDANPGGMPIDQALWWIRGIAAGVGYLHDHGIVHRDLKPGNIFLDHDSGHSGQSGQPGTVKIGDYGLSKFISCSRRSGQTESVGTVHYMAPEIANGRYGREIDTYALGIILYEMLTGHVPFEGESVGEVLMKHLTAEPELASVPQPFQEIIRRALAKDPEVRLSSVGELVAMLPADASSPAPAAPNPTQRSPFEPGPEVVDSGEYERFPGYDYDTRRHRSGQYASHRPHAQRQAVEEPMYAAVRNTLAETKRAWRDSKAPPIVQGLGLILLVMALIATAEFWIVMLVGLSIFYFIYYLFWTVFLKPGARALAAQQAVAAPPADRGRAPTATSPEGESAPRTEYHQAATRARPKPWREVVRRQIAAASFRERTTELLGSMLLSALLCVLASAIVATVMTDGNTGDSWQALHLWISIVSTLGCWGVLLTNKLTEARVEDQAPMRALMLGAGALLGLVAFALTDGLSLQLPSSRDMGPGPHDALVTNATRAHVPLRDGWNQGAVSPGVAVSMAYFALLFAAPRWWRLAEFTRDKRLSLWSVTGLVILAWIAHVICWYPQPLGMALAAVIAIVTQLSSPWFPPSKRVELAKQRAAI